jgi:hypothetical protein
MKIKIACLTALVLVAAAALIGQAQALGYATFFARLNAAGGTVIGSGVASSSKIAVGRYEVTFNRPIQNCATLVTIEGATAAYGTARRKPASTTVLQVFTYTSTGAFADRAANVFVLCNPPES